jgi:hypothetical protein
MQRVRQQEVNQRLQLVQNATGWMADCNDSQGCRTADFGHAFANDTKNDGRTLLTETAKIALIAR